MTGEVMSQIAPFPVELAELVDELAYRPGWRFRLVDMERDPATTHSGSARGLTLIVFADVFDSYHPEIRRPVNHFFVVPAATYDRRAWLRWLLDRVLDVEQHEACEWFRLGEQRPYAPNHGPGRDPYTIVEYATDLDRRTSFRGEVVADPEGSVKA